MIQEKITISLLILAAWLCRHSRSIGGRCVGNRRGQKQIAVAAKRHLVSSRGRQRRHANYRCATTTYQTMSGFGAAMTDSSAWLLQNKLPAAQRDKLMRQMFSPESGIGINYLRVPLGASDFTASNFYTYDDNPPGGTDEFQQQFSISHDQAYIIPRLQQARQLNPSLGLLGSP